MSFLIDPPWLHAPGRLYGAAPPPPPGRAAGGRRGGAAAPEHLRGRTAAALGAATMAGFWGTSVSLYLDKRWTTPTRKACRARSGRDRMLTSGVFRCASA